MTEWWTYRLSDFLMFSPQVYWRLVARHNAAWWPAQWIALGAVALLPLLLRSRATPLPRAALGVLALAWAWVGWAFHWSLYSEIFLGARWAAFAGAAEALLLLAVACWPHPAAVARPSLPAASWILLAAALLYPLLAPLTGHAWREAEAFGFMPEPTALATVGVLVGLAAWPRWQRALLAVTPVASLLLGAATRWLIAQ
jgi:hypothetical protein